MLVQVKQSRRGPQVQDVFVNKEFVGVVRLRRDGGLMAVNRDGVIAEESFAKLHDAAKWLNGGQW